MVTNKIRSERAYFMCSQEGEDAMVCLESEVVKVIAELNEQSESLKDELRHQKYKRCLAMAEYCKACMNQFPFFGAISKEEVWWQKWHDRWYDLAEKFKEGRL